MDNGIGRHLPQQVFFVDIDTPRPAKKIIKDWNFTQPPDILQPLVLLTVMGIAVTALVGDDFGVHYVAWALPDAVALCGQLH